MNYLFIFWILAELFIYFLDNSRIIYLFFRNMNNEK